jgi:predicted Zn-dependent peptidase
MPRSALERDIQMTELPNGVRVITEPMPAVRSVAAGFWIGTGSRCETPKTNGISHFIEHMLFKGTPTRSAEQIAREMDSIGGNLDAFTGRDLAGYTMKVLDEHLDFAFGILADMLKNPRFDPADIEKEKGVILEELKMENDDPEDVVHELFVGKIWNGHPLGMPIIGHGRTIRSFDESVLRAHHRRHYCAANLIVTAAGNLRHDRVIELVQRHLDGLPPGEPEPEQPVPGFQPPFELKSRRSLQQLQLCLGTPMIEAAHPLRLACFTLNVILGGSMSSRLFQNIREQQGLAYSIFSELNLYRDTGSLGIYAGTSPENGRRVLDSTLAELRRLREEPVPEDELRRAREHMKGSLLLSLESTTSRMSNLARQWMTHGRFFTLDELAHEIDSVTADQIQQVAREYFQPGKIGLAALGRIDSLGITQGDLTC